VERALLYKSSKVHLKRPAHARENSSCRGLEKNAGVVDIGDGFSRRVQNRIAQFIRVTSSLSRRHYRRWRDPPRHFHHGARPIAILDSLRFGEIAASKLTSEADATKNRRILDGVVRAWGATETASAFPPSAAKSAFEPCYSQNPLVNALALGIAKKEEFFSPKLKGIGKSVIYVGAKTGRDGIHGASLLASAEFTEESKQKRPNVQVGDPS